MRLIRRDAVIDTYYVASSSSYYVRWQSDVIFLILSSDCVMYLALNERNVSLAM